MEAGAANRHNLGFFCVISHKIPVESSTICYRLLIDTASVLR